MPRRREVPYSPIPSHGDGANHDGAWAGEPPGRSMAVEAAPNLFAALQRAAPHEQIGWTQEQLLPLREVIEDAIDELPERERWIFNACVVERKSIRAIADDLQLAKSYVHRLRDAAVRKLRAALEDHPMIKEYLNR